MLRGLPGASMHAAAARAGIGALALLVVDDGISDATKFTNPMHSFAKEQEELSME